MLDRGKLQVAQKVYELALERSEAYNAPHFLIKVNFGLAKVHFLLENHSISYSHIEKAFSHVKKPLSTNNLIPSEVIKSRLEIKFGRTP